MDKEQFTQQFIASVSHEFRTPLASLTALLEIFWDEADHLSRAEIRELLKSLQLSVTNLHVLVDNLLDTASIQAEQFAIKPQAEALSALIASAVGVMQPLLDRRAQTLSYHAPLALPLVWADGARIQQALVNLLMNASKYSPQGSQIDISAEILPPAANGIKIAIADQGQGIPPEHEAELFAPFTRFDTSAEEGGLGMGLAVVKTIIESHGGAVGATRRDPNGSIFWFTLSMATGAA